MQPKENLATMAIASLKVIAMPICFIMLQQYIVSPASTANVKQISSQKVAKTVPQNTVSNSPETNFSRSQKIPQEQQTQSTNEHIVMPSTPEPIAIHQAVEFSEPMGVWFSYLKHHLARLEKHLGHSFTVGRKQDSVLLQQIPAFIKAARRGYANDIQNVVRVVERESTQKDIFLWISQQQQKAITIGQKRRAQSLQKFINRKRFDIYIKDEMRRFAWAVDQLAEDVELQTLRQDTLPNIAKRFKDIDRKYQEAYQDLHSAATNFEFWSGNG